MITLREAAAAALAFTLRDFASARDFEAARAVLHDDLKAALAEPERRNQCGETCERAKLCAVCASELEEPQEPVAWMVYTEGGKSAYVTDNPTDLVGAYRALPLYTR